MFEELIQCRLKDFDVTWLYGPLLCDPTESIDPAEISKLKVEAGIPSGFLTPKPILRKRNISAIMLHHSLYSASLLKQAAAAVQAQQLGDRRSSSFIRYPLSRRREKRLEHDILRPFFTLYTTYNSIKSSR